jgi:hypothetical protein
MTYSKCAMKMCTSQVINFPVIDLAYQLINKGPSKRTRVIRLRNSLVTIHFDSELRHFVLNIDSKHVRTCLITLHKCI